MSGSSEDQNIPVNLHEDGTFEYLEEVQGLLVLLQSLTDSEESLRKLENRNSNVEWRQLTEQNAQIFLEKITDDKALSEAVQLWVESSKSQKEYGLKLEQWKKHLMFRTSLFDPLTSQIHKHESLPLKVGHDFLENALNANIALSVHSGMSLEVVLPTTNNLPEFSEKLAIQDDSFSYEFSKPYCYEERCDGQNIHYGLAAIEGKISVKELSKSNSQQIIFVATSGYGYLFLDSEELPWGGNGTRLCKLDCGDYTVEFRMNEPEELLLDQTTYNFLKKTHGELKLSSISITGDTTKFNSDSFLFLIFLLTGAPSLVIEKQSLDSSGRVVSVSIPFARSRIGERAPFNRTEWIKSSKIENLWSIICALPENAVSEISLESFNVCAHALKLAPNQPLQKSIVDLYQVLDTLAPLHPEVPRTKRPESEFKELKNRQKKILKYLRARTFPDSLIKQGNTFKRRIREVQLFLARKVLGDYDFSGADWDSLNELIEFQKNDFSVVQRVKSLISLCGIHYDSKDLIQRLVLDLRHRISHNLASARIIEDGSTVMLEGYTLDQLLSVRKTLFGWSHKCLFTLLMMKNQKEAK